MTYISTGQVHQSSPQAVEDYTAQFAGFPTFDCDVKQRSSAIGTAWCLVLAGDTNAINLTSTMTDSLIAQLSYVGIPIFALVGFGLMVSWWQMSASVRSMFQHLAAGVITSAVAVELLPSMLNAGSVSGLSVGYLAGVASMVFLERFAERMGTLVPVAVDLCIDGFLLMIGFATGEKGGLLLLLGLTLETASLGSVMGSALSAQGKTRIHLLAILLGLGVCVLGGAGFGMLFPAETGFLFAGVLGFGVAALLYLAVEELLTEAHEAADTPLTTVLFFVGFLIPLLLAQVGS